MAKDGKPADDGEQAASAPAPSKKKKILIILAALVLLIAIAVGAVVAVLLLKPPPEELDDDEEIVEVEKPAKKKSNLPPVYVALDPFTVNLVPETVDQYLQVVLSLECEDPAAESRVKAMMPRIRNGITLLLSSKKASELLSREGKEQLAAELKESINALITPDAPPPTTKKGKKAAADETPEPLVKEVLFTSFIIQ